MRNGECKNCDEKAAVFDIERFSVNDGHGIRTVVFLKGCTLRCAWCANPESQSFDQEIMFHVQSCCGCKACIDKCPNNAIEISEEFGLVRNSNCSMCGCCVNSCYFNAWTFIRKDMSVDEVYDEIIKDKDYYIQSLGGVTFSGGEPLLQSKFIYELSTKLKNESINTLIETCGMVDYKNFQDVLGVTDSFFYDVKHMDENIHKKYTKGSNRKIIENLIRLDNEFKGEITVRCPIITGFNFDDKSIEDFLAFVSKLQNVKNVEFLPYHRLGTLKYKGLFRKYDLEELEPLKKADLIYLKKYENQFGLNIKINT